MAINFPSTSGQATDGSFTHTASGITWAWDGTTWKATGVTSSYVLPAATANDLGGIKVGTNLSITAGVLSASGGEITVKDETTTLSTAATTLKFTGTGVTASGTGAEKTINIPGGSGISGITVQNQGTSLSTEGTTLNFTGANVVASGTGTTKTITLSPALDGRSTFTATTASLANNVAGNVDVTAYKSYSLLKIKPSIAAWVTLYVDAASRTADANRVQGADPAPDAGVIAEVITTTTNEEITMSPGVVGWHEDAGNDAVSTIFVRYKNLGGNATNWSLEATIVRLED